MKQAMQIISILKNKGYFAVIVGGAVRDILLKKEPKDVDIATNALPEKIIEIAQAQGWKTIEIGAYFGVVQFIINETHYEVATFREERYGKHAHRPEQVCFAVSLRKDLSRRDFTINAMAMDSDGNIIDYFGGKHDLKNKIIRTVGLASIRFNEDALRMFRATRLAAQLDFNPTFDVIKGINLNLDRVNGLSIERIKNEIEKTLLSDNASKGLKLMVDSNLLNQYCMANNNGKEELIIVFPELYTTKGKVQNPRYHRYDVYEHCLKTMDCMPKDIELRWTGLLHDIAKGIIGIRCINKVGEIADYGHAERGAEMAKDILSRFKISKKSILHIVWLISNHMHIPAPTHDDVFKWIRKLARHFHNIDILNYHVNRLISLACADYQASGIISYYKESLDNLKYIILSILKNIPFYPSQLKIKGKEIVEKLGQGKIVGIFQQSLLMRIQNNELKNEYVDLKNALICKQNRLIQKKMFQ